MGANVSKGKPGRAVDFFRKELVFTSSRVVRKIPPRVWTQAWAGRRDLFLQDGLFAAVDCFRRASSVLLSKGTRSTKGARIFVGRISNPSGTVQDGLEIRPTWLRPKAALGAKECSS